MLEKKNRAGERCGVLGVPILDKEVRGGLADKVSLSRDLRR